MVDICENELWKIINRPWNHKDEILNKLEFTKEWGCDIVTFIPKLEVLGW